MYRKNMPLTEIKVGDRRPVHHETVKGIAESFKAVGQLNPILVDEDGNLVAGLHRLEAAKLLEWSKIEAGIVEPGDAADLMEIDENLQRHQLDALQFSRAVAARKKLWERINGKAQPGAKPKQGGNQTQVASHTPPVEKSTFAAETAAVAGVSPATVDRAVAIGEKLTEEAVAVLENTPVADNRRALAEIAAAPPSKQVAAAKRAVRGDKPSKNGSVKGGWGEKEDSKVVSMLGQLARMMDDRARAKGKSPQMGKVHGALSTALTEFKRWVNA